MNALENAIVLEPGTLLDVDDQSFPGISFGDTIMKKVQIPVMIKRNGLVEKTLSLEVNVLREDVELHPETTALFVSNQPEEVRHSGVLLKGTLDTESAAKVILYHKNISVSSQDLLLTVSNIEDHPIRIHMVFGVGGPNTDGLFAGHLATKRYFERLLQKEGVFIDIPAHSTRILYKNPIKQSQVVSGVFRLEKLSPGSLIVSTMMVDEETGSLANSLTYETEEPKHVGGVFRSGMKQVKRTYNSGTDIMNIRIGDEPFLSDSSTGLKLRGNYGLMYELELDLVNNHSEEKKVDVYFVPSGGIARGLFILGQKVIETGLINPLYWDNTSKITSVVLKALQKKKIVLYTMPQPGSFYPVNIVLKTDE